MTYSHEARALFAILGDNSIRYIPIFAREFGGVCAGMLLSQLVYWHGKQTNPDGWIRKTVVELKEETGLTEREQESARAALKAAGVIEFERMGMPFLPHYRVVFDKLISVLSKSVAVGTKRPNSVSAKRPNKKGQNVLTSEDSRSGVLLGRNVLANSETTAEITSETTAESFPAAIAAPPITGESNYESPEPDEDEPATPPKTASRKSKRTKAASEPFKASPLYGDLFARVARITKFDTTDKRLAGRVGQTAKFLDAKVAAGLTLAQVDCFADWWRKFDWRGQRGDPPTPDLIRERWGLFFEWQQDGQPEPQPKQRAYAQAEPASRLGKGLDF